MVFGAVSFAGVFLQNGTPFESSVRDVNQWGRRHFAEPEVKTPTQLATLQGVDLSAIPVPPGQRLTLAKLPALRA